MDVHAMKTLRDSKQPDGSRPLHSKAAWHALLTSSTAVLVAIFGTRAWLALTDHGIFWPDEIYQTLEQAHRFAFGYGFIPWEFQDGARSWLFPGLLGIIWKIASVVGVSESPTLLGIARVFMVGLSVLAAAGSIRVARQLGGERAALTSGVLICCFPALLVFNHRAMTETASAPALVWATVFLLSKRFRTAGALGTLAIFLRYQNGLFLVGLGCMVLATRNRSAIGRFLQGALPVALLGGALDAVTWGHLFHSLIVYIRFNFVEGRASEFGVAPFKYYLDVLWSSTGAAGITLGVGFFWSARACPGLWLNCAVFVLAHSFISHKEFRFLAPVLPLVLALASVGLTRMFSLVERRAAKPVAEIRKGPKKKGRLRPESPPAPRRSPWAYTLGLVVLAITMTWRTAHLTFADMGQYVGEPRGSESAWHDSEDDNRLLWRAGRQKDLCGLSLVGKLPVWVGGYSYLHRDVPFYYVSVWAPLSAQGEVGANYLMAAASYPAPPSWVLVAREGDVALFRKDGDCGPPPNGYREFPKPRRTRN